MHKVKSMLLTLLCMGVVLCVGYLMIMESGRRVLENGIMLEETDYESTSSNIFYGKIEEDIELFPWNYYPGDDAEVGWSSELGTHPLFQFSIMASDPDIVDVMEEELKSLQSWYLCRMIAYKADCEAAEVWDIYNRRQHTLMDEIRMVESSPIGYLYFYQDTLNLNGKRYQVRICFTQWNVISFICMEERIGESRESEAAQDASKGQGSGKAKGSGVSQGGEAAQDSGSQEAGKSQGTSESQGEEAAQDASVSRGGEAAQGASESQGGEAGKSQGMGVSQGSGASQDTGESQGAAQTQDAGGYSLPGERQKAWEEGKEKLVELLGESEAQMEEYFAYMTFLREWDDTAFYMEDKDEYVNCYLKSLQWLDRIQKGEEEKDEELSRILWRIDEIKMQENGMFSQENDADVKIEEEKGNLEETEAEAGAKVGAINSAAPEVDYDLLEEPAETSPSFSYQIVDLKDMILLLMQGENNTIGIFYDPIAQEFCGYNYFYEY